MMYSYDNVMEMIPRYHDLLGSTSLYFIVVGDSDGLYWSYFDSLMSYKSI